MNIVVAGGGKVGSRLAEAFCEESHNVVLIDIKSKVCEHIQDDYDVMCVCGSGTDIDTLRAAGTNKADLFIAVTDNDEYNALAAVMAKKLGAKRCAARVRSPEYSDQLEFMRTALGIDVTVNPEYGTAAEIARILRFPEAIKTETFAKGRIELIEIKIAENNALCGMALFEIYRKFRIKILICAIRRGNDVFIPHGEFVIKSGDKIHITAKHRDIANFLKAIGVMQKKVKTSILIGGGHISYYLANMLIESGINVKIIEQNEDKCRELSETLPKADIVCGDGTDRNILEEEGIDNVSSLVTLTGIDEENMIISMYAKTRGVDTIVTKVNKASSADLLENTEMYSIVTPKNIIANTIIRYVRAMQSAADTEMVTLYKIVNGKAEAMEFIVNKQSAFTSVPLAELRIKANTLIAAILRHNRILIPDGKSTLEVGDTVIVVTTHHITVLGDILA